MAFDLSHCDFIGPALPAPFVKFDLEAELKKAKLLPKTTGDEGKQLHKDWETYRRHLRSLVSKAGAIRVRNNVIEPLIPLLGYKTLKNTGLVKTREGDEDGGYLLVNGDGAPHLRVWTKELDIDLDAPARRGAAYRYSYLRIAQRVLLASGERVGLLTNGSELRILISDPARPDSQVVIPIATHWKRSRDIPDDFLLLLALCSPDGIAAVQDIVDKARLKQATVTRELRTQARRAVERFVQEILDHPENKEILAAHKDKAKLARDLWHEGLVIIYRLLFILKAESDNDAARIMSCVSASIWRNTYSPSMALAPYVRAVLDRGAETGSLLENGLRVLFRMFADGIESREINVKPLGGSLFGADATPLLTSLKWGERAVAHVLDQLLWTIPRQKGARKNNAAPTRERVHYGPLDVEDLGRVYEALLELEPGITSETMCRLQRAKLQVVVPVAQGEKYRKITAAESDADMEEDVDDDSGDDDDTGSGKKTKVEFVEEIPPGKFYLRVGLGRKTTGSYYTPHSFVRFLVQETCGPLVEEKSPKENPNPLEILKIKVLDPAMGSGHFLVEACRFLGEKLYEACRLCDELATAAEKTFSVAEKLLAELHEKEKSSGTISFEERKTLRDEITAADKKRKQAKEDHEKYWQRVVDLPDPDDEILSYLPSRAPEGVETGLSDKKALALCRRLIAVHCLYGVDKNPLAVELAKLSLWLESHAEGLPLTFLDHRLVVGDSLTGPFWEHLLRYPGSRQTLENLFAQDIYEKFTKTLSKAVMFVDQLQATVGSTLAEIENKKRLKADMDRSLAPFKVLAAAWSGGVMLGPDKCDDSAYAELVKHVGETGDLPETIAEVSDAPDAEPPAILRMIALGLGVNAIAAGRDAIYALMENGTRDSRTCIPALPYDLTFPEVFFPYCQITAKAAHGFHAVLGNPPWDVMMPADREFFAAYDFEILNVETKKERTQIRNKLLSVTDVAFQYESYINEFGRVANTNKVFFNYQVVKIDGAKTIGKQDLYRLFCERIAQVVKKDGWIGFVVPSAFHANEGATGIRQLYLQKTALKHCYSFENRKKLFEIDSRFKFACVVAKKDQNGTDEFNCAFYLHDDEYLFSQIRLDNSLKFKRKFIELTGAQYLSFLELQSKADAEAADQCFMTGTPMSEFCNDNNLSLGREIHFSDDAEYIRTDVFAFDSIEKYEGYFSKHCFSWIPIFRNRNFWQFSDWTGDKIDVAFDAKMLKKNATAGKDPLASACFYYRFAWRHIASATNQRTSIFAILPPATVSEHNTYNDRSPSKHPLYADLFIIALANTFSFDFLVRLMAAQGVDVFVIKRIVLPKVDVSFASHIATRLTCNHLGFTSLWKEQLGDAWREPGKAPFTWPVLGTEEERWEVRSAIDAVVADAYGLSREQYEHVLRSFDMPSTGPNPHTDLCLSKYDELKKRGLDAFTRKYDPYHDMPLNETLPKPVISLPGISGPDSENSGDDFQLISPRIRRQRNLDFEGDA